MDKDLRDELERLHQRFNDLWAGGGSLHAWEAGENVDWDAQVLQIASTALNVLSVSGY